MAVQRKSQIPKAPERSLLDSIAPGPTPVPEQAPAAPPVLELAPEAVREAEPEESAPKASTPALTLPPVLKAPARARRKPMRILYTSKMDPEIKAWAMSFKSQGEDFVEVVEQALWVLRLARAGHMDEAVAALKQATEPIED